MLFLSCIRVFARRIERISFSQKTFWIRSTLMETTYDLSRITRSLKTDEKVIAFTGFSIDDDNQPGKEGVLKISAYSRSDWSG